MGNKPEKNSVIIRFQKVLPSAKDPVRGSEWAAGWDLSACATDWDDVNKVLVYHTGIAVEIPRGYVGLLFPRSSIYKKTLTQTNCVGVIDADYRGEILVKFSIRYHSEIDGPRLYDLGDRIVQLVIVPVPEVAYMESASLSETKRGSGGYGSSGA
jgi:dUTP pyrophosphatase